MKKKKKREKKKLFSNLNPGVNLVKERESYCGQCFLNAFKRAFREEVAVKEVS